MHLLSFLKRGQHTASLNQRFSSSKSIDNDESEYTLKQRARRRLIGASLLVILSVLLLPRIFDTVQPVPHHDIKINLLSSTDSTASVPAPDASKTVTPLVDAYASSIASLSQGEKVIKPMAVAKTQQKESHHVNGMSISDAQSHKVATKKFLLKAGAFASETRAHNWLAKLKSAKLPAYIEHKKLPEGDRYLVRVGPYADYEFAQAVQKKLQTMGLPSIISEGSS